MRWMNMSMGWFLGLTVSVLGPNGVLAHDRKATFLVFDLDLDGLHLSDRYYPVDFDIDGDGTTETTSWTAEHHNDAFLWLDRDGNGRADGSELFGATASTPGGTDADCGFEVLNAYDRPVAGGNGDGTISEQDGIWKELRLWIDWDHDGRTRSEEVFCLDDWAILEIGLEYETMFVVDGSLNLYRHLGSFRAAPRGNGGGRVQEGLVTEVHFDL